MNNDKEILNRIREFLEEYIKIRNQKLVRESFQQVAAWKICPEAYQAGYDDAMAAVSSLFIKEVLARKRRQEEETTEQRTGPYYSNKTTVSGQGILGSTLCMSCKFWQRNTDMSGVRLGKCTREYPASDDRAPETDAWSTCGKGRSKHEI